MIFHKSVQHVRVITLVLYLSDGIFSECINDRPQWFMQLGFRDPANYLKANQRGRITQYGTESSQNNKDPQPENISEDKIKEEVQNSPLPLELVGGKYYYFGIYFKTNYFKAMEFCENHGMELLSIESSSENHHILNYLTSNYAKIGEFWTSGTDLGQEGEFVWLSKGKHFSFTYWTTPQPDNSGKVENCVQIRKINDGHYMWNDVICTHNINFICELKACSNFCTNTP